MKMKWLDDSELLRLSRLAPSTAWGRELMTSAWPQRFPTLLSSDTYRGYATILSRVYGSMRSGTGVKDVEIIINRVDQDYKGETASVVGSDLAGGAGLALANAWSDAHTGVTLEQIAAALESQLIYAARMFATALQQETRGRRPA
jgi:hypothetical protein